MHRIVAPAVTAFIALLSGSILASPARAGGPVAALGEVQPGFYSSLPGHTGDFVTGGDETWFVAWDLLRGREPRRFDGTGVSLIEDVQPGPVSGIESAAVAFGERFYFAAARGLRRLPAPDRVGLQQCPRHLRSLRRGRGVQRRNGGDRDRAVDHRRHRRRHPAAGRRRARVRELGADRARAGRRSSAVQRRR
jgi:hypothetical protein